MSSLHRFLNVAKQVLFGREHDGESHSHAGEEGAHVHPHAHGHSHAGGEEHPHFHEHPHAHDHPHDHEH